MDVESSSKPDLNSLLQQTVDTYRLRDILTKFGIPKDETVMVHIKNSDDKIVASCQMASSSNEFPVVPPLTNLREEIIKILNQGEDKFGLISAFPGTQSQTQTSFALTLDIGTVQVGDPEIESFCIQTAMLLVKCMRPNCPNNKLCCFK